jgi:FMN phosphatase YigB (HAD superfamily)
VTEGPVTEGPVPEGPVTGGKAPIKAVFFDVGETLVNEGEIYARWADWFGVPRHSFLAKLGAFLATGRTHMDLLRSFRPGLDLRVEEKKMAEAGLPIGFGASDLYPDARACLAALRAQGLYVGIAGNQPVRASAEVAALGLDTDVIGISEVWGVEKPAPEFFARCADLAGRPPGEILYVGDRVDNDVRPALAFGMQAAFLRRGPWGFIQGEDGAALEGCTFVLDDLTGLPDLVAAHNDQP